MPPVWRPLTVGTAAVLALGYNKDRVTWALYNLSSNIVYWDHHATVTIATGGPIAQYQVYILEEYENDDVHEPVYLIAAQDGNDVRVYEHTGARRVWNAWWDNIRES